MAAKKNSNVPTEVTTGTVTNEKQYLVPVEVVIRTTYYLKSHGESAGSARDALEDHVHTRFTNKAHDFADSDKGEELRKQICDEIATNATLSTDTHYEFSVGFDGIIHQR